MSTFRLELAEAAESTREAAFPPGLGSPALYQNARWFIRVRWMIVLFLAAAALVCTVAPGLLRAFGLVPPRIWPWALTVCLALANIVFKRFTDRLTESSPRAAIEANIRLQTAVDLAAVTVLVHLAGATASFVPFIYLFHIAAACVLLPRRASLLVALTASALYLGCVYLEILGVLPDAGIMENRLCMCQQDAGVRALFAIATVFIWIVVWYLLSTMSKAIRTRDRRLEEAYERILRADAQQNRQVLRTTHDLKVPFTGIETSIQILRYQHWDEIPESVRAVIERIERRAARLRKRISDILLVGAIRSQPGKPSVAVAADLRQVVEESIERSAAVAAQKRVTLHADVPPFSVAPDPGQLTILIANLVSNAVTYSDTGATVEVTAEESAGKVFLSVSDQGIGIAADDLPHIFDDYFRTEAAAEINKMSTGLGLAIVKEIAAKWRLSVEVTSEAGQGTTFKIGIPKSGA